MKQKAIYVLLTISLLFISGKEVAAVSRIRVPGQPATDDQQQRVARTPLARTSRPSSSQQSMIRSSSEESFHGATTGRRRSVSIPRLLDSAGGASSSTGSLQFSFGTSPHNGSPYFSSRGRARPTSVGDGLDEFANRFSRSSLLGSSPKLEEDDFPPIEYDYSRGPIEPDQITSNIVAFKLRRAAGKGVDSSSTLSSYRGNSFPSSPLMTVPSMDERQELLIDEEPIISEEEKTISEEEKTISEEEKTISEEEKTISEEDKIINGDKKIISEEEKIINGIVQSAFFESIFAPPPSPPPSLLSSSETTEPQPKRYDPFESFQRIVDLQPSPKQLDKSLNTLSAGKDIEQWNQVMKFRDLLAQFLFYQNLMDSSTLHHAAITTDINVWSIHLAVPSLQMIFLSTSLLHKVAENVEWMVNAGFRQPFLKLSAEYVVRRRFDSSPITGPASTSGASSPHINSRFGGGANSRVAASTSSTQMSEVASELQESTEELPTQFAKVKMALSNMDASTELVEGVVGQSAGNSERLIDADLSIALVNGMHGAVALADKVLPAETLASLPTSNQIMPFLTGAHLVLNCIKVALDPTVLMKEHTMLLTITVKTLDLVEHVKRTSADMRSADGDDDDDADADDDGGYYSDGGDEGFHQDDDDDDDNNNNNNNSDDRNLAR